MLRRSADRDFRRACGVRRHLRKVKLSYYKDAARWKARLAQKPIELDHSTWTACFGDYKLITRSAENVLGGLRREEVFSLAYEHLTNHPRETLAALCRFLELPLPPRWLDAASAVFRPSSGSAKYVVWAGTVTADRRRANVDKLVKGARAVLPNYSLPE